MCDIIDMIPADGTFVPVVSTDGLPVDLLNRQGIVDQLMELFNILSNNCGSSTFALTGKWGSGKTFVLNMLQRRLQEYQAGERYIVFHYNCWEYDYYDEPLMAIVAAMLDSMDEETYVISDKTRTTIQSGIAFARPLLQEIAKAVVKNKLGIDITEAVALAGAGISAVEKAQEDIEAEYEYDQYYSFNRAIQAAKKELKKLAVEKTIVVVVDELDRCLPNYAIKVLERLHHLFYGMENTVVILAVDKSQLENTVKQIFGEHTKADAYLKKFISFELALDVGTIIGNFQAKYPDYAALFDESLIESNFSLDHYFSALFFGIEIRTQERLMERITAVHKLLFPNEKKDYSFMCFELMWLVFTQYYECGTKAPITLTKDNVKLNYNFHGRLSEYLQNEWECIYLQEVHKFPRPAEQKIYTFGSPTDFPGVLLWYLWQMYPSSNVLLEFRPDTPDIARYRKNLDEMKEVEKLLQLIQ